MLSSDEIASLWSTAIVMAAQRGIPDVQVFAHLVEQAAYERAAKRPQIEVSLAAGLGYWGIALCVGAQSFALLAEFATLTEADVYAERLRKALGIIGDSDACR